VEDDQEDVEDDQEDVENDQEEDDDRKRQQKVEHFSSRSRQILGLEPEPKISEKLEPLNFNGGAGAAPK